MVKLFISRRSLTNWPTAKVETAELNIQYAVS